jgi:hypothetical protein
MNKALSKPLRFNTKVIFFLAVSLFQAGISPVEAATWKKPVPLSANDAVQPDAAIDSVGNVVSVWVEKPDTNGAGQIWTKSRKNGVWSAASALDLSIDNRNPKVETSAAGYATAVWTNSSGVWSANRPAGANWTAPTLLVPTPTAGLVRPLFSMNNKGEALLTWVEGSLHGLNVNYIKRQVNANWSLPSAINPPVTPFVVLLGGTGVGLADAAIGENGNALVAWTSYGIHPHGYNGAQQLQVSRLPKTGTTWQTSSILGIIDNNTLYDIFKTSLLLDAQGRAGVIYYNYDTTTLTWNWVIAKQAGANQLWAAPSILPINTVDTTCDSLMAPPNVNGIVGCWKDSGVQGSARADDKGNITFMFTDSYGYYDSFDGTFYAQKTKNIAGNLGTTAWTRPNTLLAYDDTSNYWSYGSYWGKYDVGGNGAGVFAWAGYNPTTFSPLLKVRMRSIATGPWNTSLSYNFNTPNSPGSVLDVKVNQKGNATVLYENYDSVNRLISVATYN